MSANELKHPVTTPPFSSLLLFSTLTTFIVTCSSVNYQSHRQQFNLHSLSSVQPLTTSDRGEVTSFRQDQLTIYPTSSSSSSSSRIHDDSYGHSDQQWLNQQQQSNNRHQSNEFEPPQSSHGIHGYAAVNNEHRQSHLYDSSTSNTHSDVTDGSIQRKSYASNDRTRRNGRRSINSRSIRPNRRSDKQCITCSSGITWDPSTDSSTDWSSDKRSIERRSSATRPSINKRWLEDSRSSYWPLPKYSGHLQPSFDRGIEQQSPDRYSSEGSTDGATATDIDTDNSFTSQEDDESTHPPSALSSYFTKSSLSQDVEGYDKHPRDTVDRYIEKVNSLEPHRNVRSHSHGHEHSLLTSPASLLVSPAHHSQHNSLQLSRTLAVPEESAGYFANSVPFSHPGHMIQLPRSNNPSQVQSPMDWSSLSSSSLGASLLPQRTSFEREPRVSRSLSLKGHFGPLDGEMPDLEDENGDDDNLSERNYDLESRGKSSSGHIDADRMSSYGSGREVLRKIKQQSQYAQMMNGDSSDSSEQGDEQSFADRIGRSGGASNYEMMSSGGGGGSGSKRGSWSRQYWRKLSPDSSSYGQSSSHLSPANGFDGYLQGLYGTPPPQRAYQRHRGHSRSSGPVTMDNLPYLDPMPALDKTLMENFLRSNSKLPSALLGSESFGDPENSDRSNSDSHRSPDSSARDSILQGLSRISIPRFTSLFSGRSDSRKRRKHTKKQSDDDDDDEEDSSSCSDSNDSSDSRKSVKIVDPPVFITKTASNVTSSMEKESNLSLLSSNSTIAGTSSLENTFQMIPVSQLNGTSATNELITSSVNSSAVTVLPVTTPLIM